MRTQNLLLVTFASAVVLSTFTASADERAIMDLSLAFGTDTGLCKITQTASPFLCYFTCGETFGAICHAHDGVGGVKTRCVSDSGSATIDGNPCD